MGARRASRSVEMGALRLFTVATLVLCAAPTEHAGETPVPHTNAACSRELSREASSAASVRILRAAAAAGVTPARACALLPSRGLFHAAEAAKRRLSRTAWQCGVCGPRKRFRTEGWLDAHWARAHEARAANASAAAAAAGFPPVCLADHCTLLGCASTLHAAAVAVAAPAIDEGERESCHATLDTCFPMGGSDDDVRTALLHTLRAHLCDTPLRERALTWWALQQRARAAKHALWGGLILSVFACVGWGLARVIALDKAQPLLAMVREKRRLAKERQQEVARARVVSAGGEEGRGVQEAPAPPLHEEGHGIKEHKQHVDDHDGVRV